MKYIIWHNMYPDWDIRMLYMSWYTQEMGFWNRVDNLKLIEKE